MGATETLTFQAETGGPAETPPEFFKPFILRIFTGLHFPTFFGSLRAHFFAARCVPGTPVIGRRETLVIAVDNSSHPTLTEPESACSERLARFFPEVHPVQIPASLQLVRPGAAEIRESVLVEFAGAGRMIFSSSLPLEFADLLLLQNEAGQQQGARVIAVQYHEGRSAVAVQVNGHLSWMKRP